MAHALEFCWKFSGCLLKILGGRNEGQKSHDRGGGHERVPRRSATDATFVNSKIHHDPARVPTSCFEKAVKSLEVDEVLP